MNPTTFIAILHGDPTRLALGILKKYVTKALMDADLKPQYEHNGFLYDIEFGNIVGVTGDGTNNGLYRRVDGGWEYVGSGTIEGVGDGAVMDINVVENESGKQVGLEAIKGANGVITLSVKTEPQTIENKQAGHIVLKTNESGEHFGDVKDADIDVNSLKIKTFLEVPELRYNRVKINAGDNWTAPGGGIIKSVDATLKIITLKLEDGEVASIAVNDICMGIFHSAISEVNSTNDSDDSKGNRSFAGFSTCYFRITEIIDNASFYYQLRPVSANYPVQGLPSSSMTFVSYGNFTNTDRQTSRYTTRTYERFLQNMDSWEQSAANIAAQFGDLSNLSVHGYDMTGYSMFLRNIYMTGTIQQFALTEPLRMEIDSTMGWMLGADESTEITVKVYKGWVELNSYIELWSWTRDTGDAADDLVWNNAHSNLTSSATLTFADLGSAANTNNSCLITITATYNENDIPQTVTQTIAI